MRVCSAPAVEELHHVLDRGSRDAEDGVEALDLDVLVLVAKLEALERGVGEAVAAMRCWHCDVGLERTQVRD